jgi:predicted DNA-binding protein
MASVETTTIRVRRGTHKRLQEEARRQGKSVTELVEEAVEFLEEQRILASAERAWEELAAMPAEVAALDGSLTDEEIAQLDLDPT